MSMLGALAAAAADEANAVAEAPNPIIPAIDEVIWGTPVSYTHLRAHET